MIDRRRVLAAGAAGAAGWLALGGCHSDPDEARPVPTSGHDASMRELRYGADPSQFAELSMPAATDRDGRPPPVAVVVHGGSWTSTYDLSLGRPLTATLPPRGWAALNVEYRRVGNAGGFAARLDLRRAAADRLGNGAAQAFLGGEPDEVPEHYDEASPIEHLPLGVPILCIHGDADADVPLSQSEAFVDVAAASGDDAELITAHGDHFVLIDPTSVAWSTVLDWLDGS